MPQDASVAPSWSIIVNHIVNILFKDDGVSAHLLRLRMYVFTLTAAVPPAATKRATHSRSTSMEFN